ncbi:hematopoietic lineage cell-specific protein [Lasius niger]|uniref:Hematopoietic lineage cell-specific protein n=1 Tax=Lasius niger TaxID=67767 RepID=A0A0J7KHV3_LASNI|nr:hematopoietic lineage cell-specific protein [Lasius niger]
MLGTGLAFSLISSTAFARNEVDHHVKHLAQENSQVQGNGSLDGMMELQRQNDSIRNSIVAPEWERDLQLKNMAFQNQMTDQQVAIKEKNLEVAQKETEIEAEKQNIENSRVTTNAKASRTIAQGETYRGQADAYRGQGDAYRGQRDAYRGEADAYRGQGEAYKGVGKSFKNGKSKMDLITAGGPSVTVPVINAPIKP